MKITKDDLFSTQETTDICGVTNRQLQWWDETGLVTPSRRINNARNRQYSAEELIRVYVVIQMRARGIGPRGIRRCMNRMNRVSTILSKYIEDLLAEKDGIQYLLAVSQDKVTLLLAQDDEYSQVIETIKTSKGPLLLISLNDIVTKLKAFKIK